MSNLLFQNCKNLYITLTGTNIRYVDEASLLLLDDHTYVCTIHYKLMHFSILFSVLFVARQFVAEVDPRGLESGVHYAEVS